MGGSRETKLDLDLEKKRWSVTELVTHLRQTIELDDWLQNVYLEGEITNFTHHRSGHMYFALKDERAQIKAVMFERLNRSLSFTPKNGDRVIVKGRLSVFERDGQVQLYVHRMNQLGMGDLFVAFQQLKERLEIEGLFDQAHKKALPPFPKKIGVVTSPSGAVIRDIITTVERRYPIAQILLCPVAVQGETAATEISQAIQLFNELKEVDILIVGRGGGSLEELWAFNEEVVVRSIFHSQIPVISAVGHETDVTLSDFVADLRAPTPTAAAELAVPFLDELKEKVASLQQRLLNQQANLIKHKRERLLRWLQRPVFQQPGQRLEQYIQRLDYLQTDLIRLIEKKWTQGQQQLERLESRLVRHHPERRLSLEKERLGYAQKELIRSIKRLIEERRTKSQHLIQQLDALSPLQVMKRGYSLTYRLTEKELIKSVKQTKPGDLIRVRLADGQLKCQIWGSEEEQNE